MDTFTPEERSRIMAAVKDKDTRPELLVRRLLREMGFHYRLHPKDVPGKPDISFKGRKKAIFIHGCFWHGHACKRGARTPKTNREYWEQKINRNKQRDVQHRDALRAMGWDVLTLWECELKDISRVMERLTVFME